MARCDTGRVVARAYKTVAKREAALKDFKDFDFCRVRAKGFQSCFWCCGSSIVDTLEKVEVPKKKVDST